MLYNMNIFGIYYANGLFIETKLLSYACTAKLDQIFSNNLKYTNDFYIWQDNEKELFKKSIKLPHYKLITWEDIDVFDLLIYYVGDVW